MAKRGNAEGSISKRKDGRWMARLSLPGGKRKHLYGATRAEVAQKLAAATRDRDQGLPVLDERETVASFLTTWLEQSVKPSVRPSTYRSYEGHVRMYLIPAIGRIRLARLSPKQVQAMMNDLLARGLSPMTVLHVRATLRSALNLALSWDMVARNAVDPVKAPKTNRYKIQPLSLKDAEALYNAVRGHRLETLFTVALAIGLRQGEALGLHWEDVDLDRGSLRVRHALQRVDGKLRLVEPKSESSRRTIPLPQVAIKAMRQHRALQNRERLAAGDRWTDNGLVFTTSIGTPLDGPNVTRTLQRLLKQAGLRPHRFHDLRHDCVTLLIAQGVPARVIMQTLGHSQISLTMNTYGHVMEEIQREAADKMDDALGGVFG